MTDDCRFRLVNARTPRSRALGNALRKARLDNNIGLRQLAKEIDRDASLLSRWETGDRTPPPTEVAQILGKLGVTGVRYAEILELAQGTENSRWLATTLPDLRAQVAALVDFEATADVLTDVAPLVVPGLLQTRNYARAIMTAVRMPEDEIDERVDTRVGRRHVLTRDDRPVRFIALIGEGALRQLVGTRAIMAEQLAFLLDMAERPNVEIRVVPYDSGWHPGLDGSTLLIESRTDPAVVYLGIHRSGLFLHGSGDVMAYREAVDDVMAHALAAEDSLAVIALTKAEWESS